MSDAAPDMPALVVVWSPFEPWRVGEVLLIDRRGEDLVFGRGQVDGGSRRLRLYRQRPGVTEETPPVESGAISRDPLIVTQTAVGLIARRGGKPALRVNGVEIGQYEMLRDGDTLEIDAQMLFLCTRRPLTLPALRFARVDSPFGEPDRHGMLGESPRAWQLRDDLAFAAQMKEHVFIRGESGTGKELAATAVHRESRDRAGIFVAHSAAALPAGLIDAELFGNARNFPNPGMAERPGLIGQADGGTLFLDEIGELTHELHAHLLRVLDAAGEYRRLGEAQTRRSNFRLIAATNRAHSSLKHDFLARLGVEVELPSLRDRREDVPLLARAFLLGMAKDAPAARSLFREVGGCLEPQMTAALMDRLVRWPYTTNAREVKKLLSQALAQSPPNLLVAPPQPGPTTPPAPAAMPAQVIAPRKPLPNAEAVRDALAAAAGNVAAAARALGISRQALYRIMDKDGGR